MKKIFTLLIGIVFSLTILNSQVAPPQAFSFKATIQGANGQTVVNKMIRLRISILQDDINGFVAYSEYFTPTTNHYSQVDIEIGKGNVLSGIFSAIDWSAHKYFLKVEVDAKGGTTYQTLSTTQLLSVPYALYAGSATMANESDPIFKSHPAYGFTPSLLNNGNTAYSWGNHGSAGYLKSFIETDPIFINHVANGITNTLITNWNTAYGWGNHNGLYRPIDYVPTWSDVIGKPTFATVATSGTYNDLTDKPTTDGSETKITAGTNVTVMGEGTTTNPYSINSSGVGTTIPGNNPGDMQYWNGTGWVIVPAGQPGQFLQLTNSGIPAWGGTVLLATTVVSSIAGTYATSGGIITSDGGTTVTARGVCWSTSINPITSDSKTVDGKGTGTFISSITGLTPNTTYYLRAYAINATGPSYGNEISFTTLPSVTKPALTTTVVTAIVFTSATSGGNVTNDGGDIVRARGVCWRTSPDPTIADNKTIDGTGTGTFISSVVGLTPGTTYFLRAYATNIAGTAYGNVISFTTASTIGQHFQGGIVAYILQPGDPGYIAGEIHGLIAAPFDQNTRTEWGCELTLIPGADGTTLGTGNQNTIDIVTYCSEPGIAAKICYDLTLNGYSDWYLPSKDELNKLYINKDAIGGFDTTIFYWSSTEYNFLSAYMQHFSNGNSVFSGKGAAGYGVRAVRSF